MALKIGSTTISSGTVIRYANSKLINKVFVKGNARSIKINGDIPPTNSAVSFDWQYPTFVFEGDTRSWTKSLNYSDTSGGKYNCSLYNVVYSASSNSTTYTYYINNSSGSLHTVGYTYSASLTINYPETLVWTGSSLGAPAKPTLSFQQWTTSSTYSSVTLKIVNPSPSIPAEAEVSWYLLDASGDIIESNYNIKLGIIEPGGTIYDSFNIAFGPLVYEDAEAYVRFYTPASWTADSIRAGKWPEISDSSSVGN